MNRLWRYLVACALVASCAGVVAFGATKAVAQSSSDGDAGQAAAPVGSNPMTFALTGDSIITRKLSVYAEPAYTKMIDLIRGADAAFTNLEMLLHDYEPYPSTQSGGTYMRADPEMAKELVWAGFDMVSRSNNHTGDYGVEGMELTTKYVKAAGLVQAGVGQNLRQAREAGFLETARGRVALVSVASSFPDPSRAGESWGDTRARPGLSPLRFTTTKVLTGQQFDQLEAALKAAGQLGGGRNQVSPDGRDMRVFGQHFVVGDKQETRTAPLKQDLDEIAAVVRNASKEADYTIVYSHTHEGGADRDTPPEFFITFAHTMIDSGADIVTASGPHVLRGIEIYKGKPIFYGLGDFIFENETVLRAPPENYAPLGLTRGAGVGDFNDTRFDNGKSGFPADERIWESVIAMPRFVGGKLAELKLYPISLQFGRPRPDRGRPMLAEGPLAKKIIDDITNFSRPFGTTITFKDGVGLVAVAAAGATRAGPPRQ
jgi:poly-gamma-glutamate synthesis protein (capsule biosynthesis protein)